MSTRFRRSDVSSSAKSQTAMLFMAFLMGVHDLWMILDPVAEERPLAYLKGKRVAVDLSIWIVQSGQQIGLNTSRKPHLKNLLFRVKYMLINNVQPIFIFDGKPPEIKESTIKKRNIALNSKCRNEDYDGGSGNRENFATYVNECEELLNFLGVPCFKCKGEAESLCAYLNAKGVVDGCITDDSDAFLYGAETVFRDFKVSSSKHKIKEYTLNSIKEKLCLNRDKLVALALLLGSDYNKGIPGIGKETALGMFREMGHLDILQRFADYKSKTEIQLFPNYDRQLDKRTTSHCERCGHLGTKTVHKQSGCVTCHRGSGCVLNKKKSCSCKWHINQAARNEIKHELKVYEKVKEFPDFPNKKVINEYLYYEAEIPSEERLKWRRPNLSKFLERVPKWLNLTREDCFKHMLPIITSWQMAQIHKNGSAESEELDYSPVRIVKEHVKNGDNFFEVLWKEKDGDTAYEICTSEKKDIFSDAYVDIVDQYITSVEKMKESKKKKKKGIKRLPSPSEVTGSPADLANNAKMDDYFPAQKKRVVEMKETAPNEKEVIDHASNT